MIEIPSNDISSEIPSGTYYGGEKKRMLGLGGEPRPLDGRELKPTDTRL